MPRKNAVDQHPEREAIISAILSGQSYRDISGQYAVSKSALSRFVVHELGEIFARARRNDRSNLANIMVQNATVSATSLRKVIESSIEALRDPENPERYSMVAHSDSIVVDATDRSDRKRAKRIPLSELIQAVQKNGSFCIKRVYIDQDDPRRVLISAANTATRQLAVVSRIQRVSIERDQDHSVRKEIVESDIWKRVSKAIIESFEICPDAREILRETLKMIQCEIESNTSDVCSELPRRKTKGVRMD